MVIIYLHRFDLEKKVLISSSLPVLQKEITVSQGGGEDRSDSVEHHVVNGVLQTILHVRSEDHITEELEYLPDHTCGEDEKQQDDGDHDPRYEKRIRQSRYGQQDRKAEYADQTRGDKMSEFVPPPNMIVVPHHSSKNVEKESTAYPKVKKRRYHHVHILGEQVRDHGSSVGKNSTQKPPSISFMDGINCEDDYENLEYPR